MRRCLTLIVFVLVTGCSDTPRVIVPAKAVPVVEATKGGVELPAMKAPEKSEPAAMELVKAALNAHTANKPNDVNKFKTVKFLRGGFIRSLDQQTLPQAWTIHATWPSQYRVQAELSGNQIVTLGWNGTTGWRSVSVAGKGPPTVKMSSSEVEDFQLDVTGEWLWLLFPFTDPETIVTSAPTTIINGKTSPGVRIWHPKLSPAIVHFDPDTKLLLMITYEGRESGRKVIKEFDMLEHKEFEGVKFPVRMAQKANGEQYAEWTLNTLESKPSHDAKLFEGP